MLFIGVAGKRDARVTLVRVLLTASVCFCFVLNVI